MKTEKLAQAFYQLDPEKVLRVTENCGFLPTGEFTQLNSYENRVFDLKLEKPLENGVKNVIAKFYRPFRWSKETIQDEHDFLFDLVEDGVKVVAPIRNKNGDSLIEDEGIFVTFFPKVLGRMPQEFLNDELKQVGRLIARLHNTGAKRKSKNRSEYTTEYYGGWGTLAFLENWVAPEVWNRYEKAATAILTHLDEYNDPSSFIRIHGDCHKGNLLHNGKEYFFVDFDDTVNGPPVHDFWMLLSGDQETAEEEKNLILSGYEELRDFDDVSWDLIPALRGQRIMSYAGWIATRWQDPSFPRLFPEFNTFRYWAEEVEALEKIAWNL
ncbi:MAG: serine/threonine protein kinase [Pseudobdellovibrionaceae bacterium]